MLNILYDFEKATPSNNILANIWFIDGYARHV